METLLDWMSSKACQVQKTYHCLDVIGASKRVANRFTRSGWKAVGYDIKLNAMHDITSEVGFRTLLELSIQ